MEHISNMIAFGDAPINGGLPFSGVHDVYDDCNLPECQYPEAEHSTKMAGKALGFDVGGLGDYI